MIHTCIGGRSMIHTNYIVLVLDYTKYTTNWRTLLTMNFQIIQKTKILATNIILGSNKYNIPIES